MDIHRVGTNLTPLESWEGAEHAPIDRIGIGHLVVEQSGIVSESARKRQESARSEYHFHSRGELHEYPSPEDVPYTAM